MKDTIMITNYTKVKVSTSTTDFQNLINEEYSKLMEKRKNYFLSMYDKLDKKNPLVARFYELIQTDIYSNELLTIIYKLSN